MAGGRRWWRQLEALHGPVRGHNDDAGCRAVRAVRQRRATAGRHPPRLAIEPAGGIGFGSVAQGASREETVFLRSVGQSALLVEGVTLMSDTGDFTIIGVPPTVPQTFPAGKSLSLTVRFAPKRGGEQSATLRIACDDPTGIRELPMHRRGRDLA